MDVKHSDPGSAGFPENRYFDRGRRRALARLGLAAAAVYAAPTLLSLTPARAGSGGGGDGGPSGGGGPSGNANPTQPSTSLAPTSPSGSESDAQLILPDDGS